MTRPFDEDFVVRFGVGSGFDCLGQAWLVMFQFFSATTGTADTVALERVACFQLLDTLVDRITVHARGTGEGSDSTDAVGLGLTGGVVPSLLFVQFWKRVTPFLFYAYLLSRHGT